MNDFESDRIIYGDHEAVAREFKRNQDRDSEAWSRSLHSEASRGKTASSGGMVSVFKTPLVERVPGWLVGVFALAGALASPFVLNRAAPAILDSIIALEATWIEWSAYPAAVVGGLVGGAMVLALLANVIEWCVNIILSMVLLAVIVGALYVGLVAFGMVPWPDFLSP